MEIIRTREHYKLILVHKPSAFISQVTNGQQKVCLREVILFQFFSTAPGYVCLFIFFDKLCSKFVGALFRIFVALILTAPRHEEILPVDVIYLFRTLTYTDNDIHLNQGF